MHGALKVKQFMFQTDSSTNGCFYETSTWPKVFLKILGLVTPANGYVPEGKRTKICRIWLSGDKIYLLCRSKFSRSVCGAWKLSNDRTSIGHVTGKTHDNRMCTG